MHYSPSYVSANNRKRTIWWNAATMGFAISSMHITNDALRYGALGTIPTSILSSATIWVSHDVITTFYRGFVPSVYAAKSESYNVFSQPVPMSPPRLSSGALPLSDHGAPIFPQMGQEGVSIMNTYATTRVAQTRYTMQPQHQQYALPQQAQQQPMQPQH